MASETNLSKTTFLDLINKFSDMQDTAAGNINTLADCTLNTQYIKEVQAALKLYDPDLALHKWLAGFDNIIQNKSFEMSSIEIYIISELKKHPPFTKLVSSSFVSQYRGLINSGKMKVLHLPVDDSYNLSFPIVFKDYLWNILYTECKGSCRVLAPYKFPAIELNRSADLSSSSDEIDKGTFMYDMSVSLYHVKDLESTLRKAYNAMADFTDYCEVKKR